MALTLLEVIQTHDRPSEILQDEDTSVTMPRRLGLSDVVERQVRNYRKEAARRRRISDRELADLVRLVIRRPDSEDVFLEAGTRLAGKNNGRRPGGRGRLVPKRLAVALVRRRVRRRLQALFGRRIGGFARGGFTIEGRALMFIQMDPGGDACALVSGLCSAMLGGITMDGPVVHTACEARGDALCRWRVAEIRKA